LRVNTDTRSSDDSRGSRVNFKLEKYDFFREKKENYFFSDEFDARSKRSFFRDRDTEGDLDKEK